MDKFVIEGGHRLIGRVPISGSKNAVLPILAASLLCDGPVTLTNVPDLADVRLMLEILDELGVNSRIDAATSTVELEVVDRAPTIASYELVSQMRASFCVLGPLVGRRGEAQVSLPGGCVIGTRPVELHIKGLRAIGCEVEVEHGYVVAKAPGGRVEGGEVFLGGDFGSSVTGTANVLMAAVLARGVTLIEQAAVEPEVNDLCRFLVAMGADIDGIGTPTLRVTGVESLKGGTHRIIADRVEAATFAMAGAVNGSDVTIEDCNTSHLAAVLEKLAETGTRVERLSPSTVRVRGVRRLKSIDFTTLTYPGYPTDCQAQLMSILAIADGISVVTEKIYPDRFMHVAELLRLGAQIKKLGTSAIVQGVEYLSGAPVMASDLRAGAGLVLAALAATGESEIHRIYHIDRGYDRMESKLQSIGAKIQREAVVYRRRRDDRAAA